jgi:hypothetical protein
MPRTLTRLAVTLAAALVAAAPSRAADLDKYLPADTEVFVTVNVRQVLDSPLVKKHGLKPAREALKQLDQVNDVLADVGFDPFTDLERVTAAGPGGGEQDRGLLIARGSFNLAKFKAKAEEAAKDYPESLKIRKVPDGAGGQAPVYEVAMPGQDQTLFVALPDKETLVASPGKDYVVEAIKKARGKGPAALKDKDFQAVLERMDPRQSLSLAALGSALKKNDLGPAAGALENVDAVGGGLTLGDDLVIELVLSAKSADAAKELKKAVNDGANQGVALVGLLASQHEELALAADLLKSVKATSKDKTVTVKARLSAEALEGALDKAK